MSLSLATALATQERVENAQNIISNDKEAWILAPRLDISPAHFPLDFPLSNELNSEDFYPEETAQGLFPTSEDFINFLIDRENKLYTYMLAKHLPALRRNITAHYKAFQHEIQELSAHQPTNPVIWAAEQIPEDIDTLFIGEEHKDFIPTLLIPMLDVILEKAMGRKVIFLTEFFNKGHLFLLSKERSVIKGTSLDRRRLFPLWKALEERDIPLIGLEPDFVSGAVEQEDLKTECIFAVCKGNAKIWGFTDTVWNTKEGMYIRNKHWIEQYNKVRAENPDALIIIYAGVGHISLLYPFALPREIPGKNFIIEAVSAEENQVIDNLLAPLEVPPHLKWSTPGLVPASGFNIRIKLGREWIVR